MPSFLVVTTRDLPEAYFVARFLESRRQRLAILNITGRAPSSAVRVLRRLGPVAKARHDGAVLYGQAHEVDLAPYIERGEGCAQALHELGGEVPVLRGEKALRARHAPGLQAPYLQGVPHAR